MSQFLQFVFSGLTVGAIYSLVALGFNIIYNASDVMNFAQGEFVMIGGIATFVLYSAGVPLVLAGFLRSPSHRSLAFCSIGSRSGRHETPPRWY